MEFFDSVFPSGLETFFADFLYAKYAIAFFSVFLTAAVTFWLIKKISDLIIVVVLIGAFLAVCYGLISGSISTWGEVIGASVFSGIAASILCIPILPFSSSTVNQSNRLERQTQPTENLQDKVQQ